MTDLVRPAWVELAPAAKTLTRGSRDHRAGRTDVTQTTTGHTNVVPYTGEVKVLTSGSSTAISEQITAAMADGWQLVGPVQMPTATPFYFVATLERGVRF